MATPKASLNWFLGGFTVKTHMLGDLSFIRKK